GVRVHAARELHRCAGQADHERQPRRLPRARRDRRVIHGVLEDVGFWAYATRNPDKVALVDPDGTTRSYGQVLERVNRLSHLFRAAGLQPGDRAAFMLANRGEVLELALAFGQIGVLYTPLNHQLLAGEIGY